jgi:hypothetical protein
MREMSMSKPLVFTMLRHGADFPWRIVDIGLMGLRLDERREFRLHVWNPSLSTGDPPIHDHPYEFTSAVIVGELTNTRYVENASGDDYVRFRYPIGGEDKRRSDTVRLTATPEVLREGDAYHQFAHELHASWQQPGTVTLLQCSWRETPALTVCLRDETAWRSGQARDATREEIKAFTANALEWF